jgi:hypothetical protein
MKTWSVAVLCFLLWLGQAGFAEDPSAPSFAERARASAAAYQCRIGSDRRELIFHPKSLLRWTNPISGREAQGEVFLWTDRGRPAIVLSIYEMPSADGPPREHHEFSSLTDQGLEAVGGATWRPDAAGVEFQPLPQAPSPANAAAQRLSQMRELAARFSASKLTRDPKPQSQPLRLLRQPVHRYDAPEVPVFDGAMFAFVEATDPDLFLILEARRTAGAATWHYALARMNSGAMEATLDDAPDWKTTVLPWSEVINRADQPYAAFRVR